MPQSVYDLDVYKRAYDLALKVHRVSLEFPKIEQYALGDQMRRASKGICANMAEGFAKSYKSQPEFNRFLLMALGSAEEMQVWVDFARDLGYLESESAQNWKSDYIVVCKQLNKLISSVSKNIR